MSVVLLDPRFPAMIPVEAVNLLSRDVSYTEEVPVRVRWIIADLGGHTVDESDVLVTTDLTNSTVRERLDGGEDLVTAPSLAIEMEPQRQLEGSSSDATSEGSAGASMPSAAAIAGDFSHNAANAQKETGAQTSADSGADAANGANGGMVDGEIVGTDDHTVAVAGMRRTTRTEVPASVMDEIEDAVALMARALRQGEWEQQMTHKSLLNYLREETEELAQIVDALDRAANGDGTVGTDQQAGDQPESSGNGAGKAPQWLEQELCKELSDVLLQVLFHAEIANRRGAFDIGHVAGAFVEKLRSRAPYLFESVERQVPKTEQDRLWEEGKQRERAEREKSLGDDYSTLVKMKDGAAHTGASADGEHPHSGEDKQLGMARPVSKAPVRSASTTASGLEAAEQVIAEARSRGLKDSDIPMDIRYPMVGLEMDKPGEADRRLRDAVENFRALLSSAPENFSR